MELPLHRASRLWENDSSMSEMRAKSMAAFDGSAGFSAKKQKDIGISKRKGLVRNA